MDYRTELLRMIDRFNVESVEEFKEAEGLIMKDSKFTSITKKKDYEGHIRMLKKVKNKARKIDPMSIKIPADDKVTADLRKAFEKCLVIFGGVCDSYIQMQSSLNDKSKGAELKYAQYKEINEKVRFAKKNLNDNMHEMDVLYSELVEFDEGDDEEDFGGIEYRTYDSFL